MKFDEKRLILYALFFLCIMMVCACKQQQGQATINVSDSTQNATKKNQELESVYYRFPAPNEIFGFLNSEKIKFDPMLLNPTSNMSKYLDSKSQTLNLGIYVADLAYVTLFEAYNKSTEYYKAIHTLSEKISISSAYDLEVAKRIEKNLLNLDSLKRISVDSYSSMVEFLIVNNREKTLALIAAGAYVECLYITFNIAGKYSDNNPMIVKIADLKYAFENLYSYLQIYSDDKSVKEVAESYSNLSNLFSQMEQKNLGKTTVQQSADGNIVLGGGTKLHVTKVLFDELKKEIVKLRGQVVGS
jgi:hypothetical protein